MLASTQRCNFEKVKHSILTMPTLVYVAHTPTMKLHISADRLFAAKGLRPIENEEDSNSEDSDIDVGEEDKEQDDKYEDISPPPPPTVTPPVAAKQPAQTRPSRTRRQPRPLPITTTLESTPAATKKRKATRTPPPAATKKRKASTAPPAATKKRKVTPTPPPAATKKRKATPTSPPAVTKKRKATPPTTPATPPTNKRKAAIPIAPAPTTSLVPLPDGSYETWEGFVDAGGYDITKNQAQIVKAWVKSLDPVWISEQVKFHKAIFGMRSELDPTARDGWADVLPKPHSMNFDFCCLILMVATPAVPDTKILAVFGKLFKENYVDPKWVLEQGEGNIRAILAPLGRQNDSARYITAIAGVWHSMPRDYRRLLAFPGVGPKVALVTIYECFKDGQGAPCDIHMVRIFKALGWMPTTISVSDSWVGKETSQHEFARAAIEGWFPKLFWSQLNQTWAGLGQLFRSQEHTSKIAQWVDHQAKDWDSTLRLSDLQKLTLIHGAYK
jgi:endonuclease III